MSAYLTDDEHEVCRQQQRTCDRRRTLSIVQSAEGVEAVSTIRIASAILAAANRCTIVCVACIATPVSGEPRCAKVAALCAALLVLCNGTLELGYRWQRGWRYPCGGRRGAGSARRWRIWDTTAASVANILPSGAHA